MEKLNIAQLVQLSYMSKNLNRHDEAFKAMQLARKLLKDNETFSELQYEEFFDSYKQLLISPRSSYRCQYSIQEQEKKKEKSKHLNELKDELNEQIKEITQYSQSALDIIKLDIQKITEGKKQALLLKYQGDFLRYLCEINEGDSLKEYLSQAENTYIQAISLIESNQSLKQEYLYWNILLNYSIFLYEIKFENDKAVEEIKILINSALKLLQENPQNPSKDKIQLAIEKARVNLSVWTQEMEKHKK